MFMDFKKNFSPDTLGVNFEVLNFNYAWNDMKSALNDKAKRFS